jgi:hypothetical protein
MAARAKVIESARPGPTGTSKGHPCFAKGSKLKYTYADKEYPIEEVMEPGDFKRCAAAVFKALDHDKDCGRPKVGGDWGGIGGGGRGEWGAAVFKALDHDKDCGRPKVGGGLGAGGAGSGGRRLGAPAAGRDEGSLRASRASAGGARRQRRARPAGGVLLQRRVARQARVHGARLLRVQLLLGPRP